MTEEKRRALNKERLGLVDVTIRKQVAAVLATLEHYGFRPLIHGDVFRSPATQLAMFKRKVTKLRWGFHNCTRGGKPGSLAADIVDADKLWGASPQFWLCNGYAARAQGLGWGGHFGLPSTLKRGLDTLAENVTRGVASPPSRKEWEKIKKGWDVAHVQTARVTVAQAKRGKR